MGVAEFDDNNFDAEVLQSSEPVLVDFWAPWCGPCRMIAPLVEELAGENAGAIKIGKLNVDEAPGAAQSYGVSSIPTLMVFREKVILFQQAGALPASALESVISQAKTLDMTEVHKELAARNPGAATS